MIHINRPKAPRFICDPTGFWCVETSEAIAHYEAGEKKAFEFKRYSEEPLKNALKEVFCKCAYCESSYGAVYDGDVEHFRPKGRIEESERKTPGYYWLANDWDNLLLSCQHCNQKRRHILTGETESGRKGMGKLDQFPLANEKARLKKHKYTKAAFAKEEKARLLLQPCIDNPELHFSYHPATADILSETPMGKKSIEVYVLHRRLLVDERNKLRMLLFAQMSRVKRELSRMNDDKTGGQRKVFEEELDALLAFGKAEQPYAGMARFFIRQFLKENSILL